MVVKNIYHSINLFLEVGSSNGHDSIGATASVAQQAMAALEERGAKISEVAEKSEQLKEVPTTSLLAIASFSVELTSSVLSSFSGGIRFPKDDKSPATAAAAETAEWWPLLKHIIDNAVAVAVMVRRGGGRRRRIERRAANKIRVIDTGHHGYIPLSLFIFLGWLCGCGREVDAIVATVVLAMAFMG